MSRAVPPPEYYHRVEQRAQKTCQLLADQPDLAGAWHLLFEQIQNPRFVISELLQNADDAGASHAEVFLDQNRFVFQHDGEDFTEEQFAALCRFGFSNKRTIHTIGFRGIGFKSSFSLGRTVEVWTPTLGVAFSEGRFIEPKWIHDGRSLSNTRIEVRLDRSGAHAAVKESLEEWQKSPASLLFFNKIRKLTLNGQTIERTETRTRIPNTFKVELTGVTKQSVYLLRSAEEPFPAEAIEEIRTARRMKDVSDLHLGGCKVEVVLGLAGHQHLHVVLPTGEPLALPFSVNAPFLLKPDRFDIKPPTTSPSNTWLLERAGRLVADVVMAWLSNDTLPVSDRAEAYRFLPDPQLLGSVGTLRIREVIVSRLSQRPVVLNCFGKLCAPGVTAIPAPLFEIWSPKQLRSLFCGNSELLSPEISPSPRLSLARLGWVTNIIPDDLLSRIAQRGSLPKPDTWQKLGLLWEFVLEHQPRLDFDNSRKRSYPIVPVAGKDELRSATSVVRVAARAGSLSAETVEWLTARTPVFEPRWAEWIGKQSPELRDRLLTLLRAIQLHEPTPANRLVEQAAASVCARAEVTIEECVQLAQLFAALGANTPKDFEFVTHDRHRRTVGAGLVYDAAGNVAELAPSDWAKQHVLHSDYDKFVRCTRADWLKWVGSPASGLRCGFPIHARTLQINGRWNFTQFLGKRDSGPPESYHYQREHFRVQDYVLDQELVSHWTTVSRDDPAVWQKALRLILADAPHWWKDALTPVAHQEGTTYLRALTCPPITPQWITIFRDKPSLMDTHRQCALPSELYRRTADTEALQSSAEFRFVDAELDVEAVRPVLRILGVLDAPADFRKITKRLDAMRSAPVSPVILTTVSTLLHILDRIAARCTVADRVELQSLFSEKPLVMAADQSWQTSAEVSIFAGDEEAPDPSSYIHPSFQGLSLWTRLGIPQHPSVSQTLDWLRTLPSSQKLDGGTYKRVRRALIRDPLRVWEECRHWMSLDGTWEPVSRLSLRVTMQALAQFGHLAPGVRQRVADLRPISTHYLLGAPFATLPDLADAVEPRITRFVPGRELTTNPAWLIRLADAFRRVKLPDADKQARVRAAGDRLFRTRWRVASQLELTPYLDHVPAGSASPVKVAWIAQELYVVSDSAGKVHRPLVEVLSGPFDFADVAKAIDSCAHRDESFVTDYLAEYFVLEQIAELHFDPVSTSSGNGNAPSADGAPVSPTDTEPPAGSDGSAVLLPDEDEDEDEDDVDGSDTTTTTTREVKSRGPAEPSVFDRYARSLGFNVAGNGYSHQDGRLIVKGPAPFQWQMVDTRGTCLRRFWTSRDSFEKGVEVAAELWTETQREPDDIVWVVASDELGVMALTGKRLTADAQDSKLSFHPSTYRLLSADRHD